MTKTQFKAIIEVAEYGERFKPFYLNIRPATFAALVKRQWIGTDAEGYAHVTDCGWNEAKRIWG